MISSFEVQLCQCIVWCPCHFTDDQVPGEGENELVLTGKSADYLGIEGKLRYEARLRVDAEGGELIRKDARIHVNQANTVTLYFTAATNFVNYKDVSADQVKRVTKTLDSIKKKSYTEIRDAALKDYQSFYKRSLAHRFLS